MKNIIKLIVFHLILCGNVIVGFSQITIILTIDQQGQLQAYAGNDTTVCVSRPIKLHGSAIGGKPGYLYMWSPSDGLDDPALQDPTVNPDITTTYTLRVIDSGNCLATNEVTIIVDPCLEVKEINQTGKFKIYPNPNDGRFNIELNNIVAGNNSEIRIFNIYGQTVYHKNISADSFNQVIEIDIGTPLGGIYIIQVRNNKGILVKRLTLL